MLLVSATRRWSWARASATLLAAVAVLLLSACAALPMRPEVPSSVAIAASADTRLGRVAAASMPPPPESGARLVHSGTLALDARLALIRTAERSLDVQYYQVADDHTGRGFLRELGAAAARGVRVRLLLDDLHTGEQQATLVALASLANVQLRVFNPLPVRHGSWPWRLLASWPDIGRLQMRMHNKLLVADGAFALTGGRNIADEYYWQSETSAFIDLDVVVAGPVVADLAALFDLYWNSEQVWPLLALVRPDGGFAEQRRRFDAAVADARLPTVPRVALDRLGYGRLRDEIEGGRVRLHAGRARAVADLPQKVDDGPFVAEDLWDAPSEIRRVVNGVMRAAVSETFLITPYAVPGEIGVARTTVNHERGVRIRILTNSLASTDEPLVHVGYRRYRKRMIEAGAELYEVDPVPTERLAWPELRGRPVLRIHTKAAVVDQRITYIGSMNFDPRSVALNTETGVLIESQALAAEVLGLLEPLMAFGAWQVRLDADGQLQWARTGFDAPPLRSEPRTGLWQRLQLLLFGALVPESVL